MSDLSEPRMLDRFLEAFYSAAPRPKTVRLTLAQAQQIHYEMHPTGLRLAIEHKTDLLVLSTPVEWVDDEADSILGASRG